MLNTAYFKRIALLVFLPVFGCICEASGVELLLGRADIQALRMIKSIHAPKSLERLSPIGSERIFSNVADELEVVTVTDSGVWKWRTRRDIKVHESKDGGLEDYSIILNVLMPRAAHQSTLGGAAGEVSQESVEFIKQQALIWTSPPGSVIKYESPEDVAKLGEQIGKAVADPSLSVEARQNMLALAAQVLMDVPKEFRSNIEVKIDRDTIESIRQAPKRLPDFRPSLAPKSSLLNPKLDFGPKDFKSGSKLPEGGASIPDIKVAPGSGLKDLTPAEIDRLKEAIRKPER